MIGSLVPAGYGLRRLGRWERGPRLLWAWLALSALVNIASAVLGLNNVRTVDLELYAIPLLAVLGVLALGAMTGSRRLARGFGVGALVVLAGSIWCVLALERRGDFDIYISPGLAVALSLAAVVLVIARVHSGVPLVLHDAGILAGLATLLLFAPGAVLFPVSGVIYAGHPALVRILFDIRSLFQLSGSLLMFQALRWIPVTPS